MTTKVISTVVKLEVSGGVKTSQAGQLHLIFVLWIQQTLNKHGVLLTPGIHWIWIGFFSTFIDNSEKNSVYLPKLFFLISTSAQEYIISEIALFCGTFFF